MKLKVIYGLLLAVILVLGGLFYFANASVQSRPSTGVPLEAVAPNLSTFQSYAKARVVQVVQEATDSYAGLTRTSQTVRVVFLSGNQKDLEQGLAFESAEAQKLREGDRIVVGSMPNSQSGGSEYVIVDRYRLPSLYIIVGIFLVLAVVFGRLRGATAVVGLAFSMVVLVLFIAPAILAGKNAVLITLLGSLIIAVVSIFLAHGFRPRTALAVLSTVITLGLGQGLAYYVIKFTHVVGGGSEEAFLLQAGSSGALNLQGLLLGSVVIGMLGILDDVTTGQAAAVDELHQVSPALGFRELYARGMSVGREHIASLINTLVLAYAGASFPLFLFIVLNNTQPLWTVVNSEFIAEELVRTLVGSCALILAVPISTLLSAYYFKKQ